MDRSNIIKSTIFVAILFLTGFIFFKFFSIIKTWFADTSEAQEKEEEEFIGGIPDEPLVDEEIGGEVEDGFRPATTAADLHKVLTDSYWTTLTARERCQICSEAMELSDNELRLVHNAYKTKFKRSLKRDLMDAIWHGCWPWEEDAVEGLRNRLQEMQLI